MAGLEPAQRENVAKDPQLAAGLIKQTFARRALLLQAQAQKWDEKPEVQAQIRRSREEIISNALLQSVSTPPDSYPSDDELHQAYQKNQDRLLKPRAYHLAQIYLAVPDGAAAGSADAKAVQDKADKLARELKASPAHFGDTAQAQSEDKSSARNRGDLGWLPENQIAPEVRSVVAALAKGDVSEPVFASGGWHIVQLIDTRAKSPASFDEAKDELRQLLRQQRKQELAEAYMEKLLADQHAVVDQKRLAEALGVPSK
jgi:peptidylprolyl isomerase